MKLKTIPKFLLAGAVIALTGCATTGNQRSAKAGAAMEDVENDINRAVPQVDVMSASLAELIKPGEPNVKEAFKRYSSEVDAMQALSKRLLDHADAMNARAQEYFEQWRAQGDAYSDPQIQGVSERRRAEMVASFGKISEASVGVKGLFKAFLLMHAQIQSYLSNDLTPKGVAGIAPVAQQAVADGAGMKAAAEPVLAALDSARAEMARGGLK